MKKVIGAIQPSGMTNRSPKDISGLLVAWSKGDEAALNDLMPLVYEDLRGIARRQLRRKSSGNILWSGTPAVISLTNYAVPGFGTFSARVVIYDGAYAGTWGSSKHGGKMFGKLSKAEPVVETKQP